MLATWGQDITGNFRERISYCKKVIKVTKGRCDESSVKQYQEANKKLNEVYTQQEVFWRQRSKQLWLREGDRNSKFFHQTGKSRRKLNQIRTLQNNNGEDVGWDDGLQEVMISYFDSLFQSLDTDWKQVVDCIHPKITEDHNSEILRPVDASEVKGAMFHMHPDKSLGPDGMSPGFYQRYWSIVGTDVTKMVQNFFDTGTFDQHVTETNIVLVPKKQSPKRMADLRPISLCNVVYKVASKVIANRLKEVIGLVISKNQSAFIPG